MLVKKWKSLTSLVFGTRYYKKGQLILILKYLFAALPQYMSLVTLLIWPKFFMCEPHLSGVGRITHFVHDDVVMTKIDLTDTFGSRALISLHAVISSLQKLKLKLDQ